MRISKAKMIFLLVAFLLVCHSHADDKISYIINTFYPNYKLLTLNDLDSFSKAFLQETKPEIKPGVVRADFDGNDLDDFALFLYKKSNDGAIFCFFL